MFNSKTSKVNNMMMCCCRMLNSRAYNMAGVYSARRCCCLSETP